MRLLVGSLVAVLMVCSACSGSSDESEATPTETVAVPDPAWPVVDGELQVGAPPEAPEGFDEELVDRMAETLTGWAQAAALDEDVWHGDEPFDAVAEQLPDPAAAALKAQTAEAVSPHLAVANVFGDDVTVVGSPRATAAWKISTDQDDADREYVALELQTRVAYKVKNGDGPTRLVGVLRVQGLSAYPDTTDDFGVSSGWQEFGASDCTLALDDALVPESNQTKAADDLGTFVGIGNSGRIEMPDLGSDERVDAEYLERCRASTTT